MQLEIRKLVNIRKLLLQGIDCHVPDSGSIPNCFPLHVDKPVEEGSDCNAVTIPVPSGHDIAKPASTVHSSSPVPDASKAPRQIAPDPSTSSSSMPPAVQGPVDIIEPAGTLSMESFIFDQVAPPCSPARRFRPPPPTPNPPTPSGFRPVESHIGPVMLCCRTAGCACAGRRF